MLRNSKYDFVLGYESAALQTCSTLLLDEFQFELKSSAGTLCRSTGIWAFTDESFTTLNITYTSDETCDIKIGHSGNDHRYNMGCNSQLLVLYNYERLFNIEALYFSCK